MGKTSIAAGLAIAAAKEGKRVFVLTIDPSRRLAGALGISNETDCVEVPIDGIPGRLYAGVVQHKKVFDRFVAQAAGRDPSASRILKNPLYQQLSTTLSGSQEFTSLESLYSAAESGRYDLVILDTPPAQHAIDFLRAPQKLAAIFSENVSKWFRLPINQGGWLQTLFSAGTRQTLKILESLTGAQFVSELGDFFLNIENWREKIQNRNALFHRLLVSQETRFVLVCSLDKAKIAEAGELLNEVRVGGYRMSGLIVNRSWPEWFSPEAN
ncbi:MAG: adventurous gliding motility protein R, partial [Bdellovibrionaceae bacterium]|nr:adventurous gliding motility protein R [Pseudobdellovibrionaceae bacterium]